jgi:phage terminase small subunit
MLTTFRQEIFCQNVAKGSRHKDAAIAAGYSQRTASCIGAQLAKMPLVAARIQELRQAGLTVKVALVPGKRFRNKSRTIGARQNPSRLWMEPARPSAFFCR